MTEHDAPDEMTQLVGLMPRAGFNEPAVWLVLEVAHGIHKKTEQAMASDLSRARCDHVGTILGAVARNQRDCAEAAELAFHAFSRGCAIAHEARKVGKPSWDIAGHKGGHQ
jgi:hypothetical protein